MGPVCLMCGVVLLAASPDAHGEIEGTPDTGFCRSRVTAHRNAILPVALPLDDGGFGIVYLEGSRDSYGLSWIRTDSTGALIAGPTLVTPRSDQLSTAALARREGRVGLTWIQQMGNSLGVFFRVIDLDGTPVTGILRVDKTPDPEPPAASDLLVFRSRRLTGELASGDDGWAVAWGEFLVDGGSAIRLAQIHDTGVVAQPPLTVSSEAAEQAFEVQLVGNGTDFGLFWFEQVDGRISIRFRRAPQLTSPTSLVTDAEAVFGGFRMDAAWNGNEYGLAWTDRRDGGNAVYFMRVGVDGAPLSPATRLSDSGDGVFVVTSEPLLTWLGDRWAVAAEYISNNNPNEFEVALSFADSDGAKLGPDVIVSEPVDDLYSGFPALAWNGDALLVAWNDAGGERSAEIHARVVAADGTPGTNPRRILTAGHSPGFGVLFRPPELVTTDSGFMVLWSQIVADKADGNGPWLQLLDQNAVPQGSPIRVAETAPPFALDPRAASSGNTVAVAWADIANQTLFVSRFHPSGLRQGPDLLLSDTIVNDAPDVVWDGQQFLVAWADRRDNQEEIYTAALGADGTILAGPSRISDNPARARGATITGGASSRVVAWGDDRGQTTEVWAAALDSLGRRVGAEVVLTEDDEMRSDQPDLAYNGTEYGLAFRQQTASGNEVRFLRVVNALPVGQSVGVSDCNGAIPRIAWGDDRWGIVYNGCSATYFSEVDAAGSPLSLGRPVFVGPNSGRWPNVSAGEPGFLFTTAYGNTISLDIYVSTSACVFDGTAPACPTGLSASIDAQRNVTLEWTPGQDAESAIVHHYVVRDGRRLAALPGTTHSFVDPIVRRGLHQYRVVAINEPFLKAVDCPVVEADTGNLVFGDGFEPVQAQSM